MKTRPEIKATVLAEHGAGYFENDRFRSVPCFRRGENYGPKILEKVKSIRPKLIHIQHEFGIFGHDDRFINLLEMLNGEGIPLVVTLHTVHNSETQCFNPPKPDIENYNLEIGDLAGRIIVHHKMMKEILVRQGVLREKVKVIPHGTRLLRKISDDRVRTFKAKLGLPEDRKIILSFGFFHALRSREVLFEAMPEVLERVPEAHLLIAGDSQYSLLSEIEYIERCKRMVNHLGIEHRVTFYQKFLNFKTEMPLVLSSADLVAFTDAHPYRSASGVLHLAMGAGKPFVASRIPKYEVAREISDEITFPPRDSEMLGKLIIRLLTDERFRQYVMARVRKYARRTSWAKVSKKHAELYRSLIGEKVRLKYPGEEFRERLTAVADQPPLGEAEPEELDETMDQRAF
jgi:glycosyltransferase involved in cell wall biosynthesis